MTMRLSGMYSGLDTDSIIKELVKARSLKVDNVKKDKTKLEWKQEAWSSLNTKVKTFFRGSLDNMKLSSAYKKKTTKVSNSNAVSVITGDKAMKGVQSLSVDKLAKSAYLTGGRLKAEGSAKVTGETLVKDLKLDGYSGDALEFSEGGSFTVTMNGKSTNIDLDATTTVSKVVTKLNEAGLSASFDEKNGRIFLASPESGDDYDFAITANDQGGFSALSFLGLNIKPTTDPDSENRAVGNAYSKLAASKAELDSKIVYKNGNSEDGIDFEATMANIDVDSDLYAAIKENMHSDSDYATGIFMLQTKGAFAERVMSGDLSDDSLYSDGKRIAGSSAQITLNGVEYKSNNNNIEVNGLTFTALSVASDITVTTQEDTDGIYDMIRDFFKEYNDIIKEVDKTYNAKAAKGFDPLTDEEKEAMSDKEVEKWEEKAKEAILRKDTSLGTLGSTLKNGMAEGFDVNGKKMYLSDFGIETLSYFLAGDNEKAVYHINGDDKDEDFKAKPDKLKSMIATDADTVIDFFTQLSRNLYSKLDKISVSTDDTSKGSFFEDKKYKKELTNFESKIKEAEDKLAKYEDKYYSKFSKMEVALSKLESSTSSITSMLGQ